VNTTVDVVAVAVAEAERLTCCGVPGVRLKVEGEAATPDESPLVVTLIVPENPLRAVAESFTGWALPPAVRAKLDTFDDNEKSGVLLVAVTLPQPTLNPANRATASQSNPLFVVLDMRSAVLSQALGFIPRVAPSADFAMRAQSLDANASSPAGMEGRVAKRGGNTSEA
jgi:hypothetical protein